MKAKHSCQVPPFIWPDSRNLSGFGEDCRPIFGQLLAEAEALFGIVYDLDDLGARAIRGLLDDVPGVRIKLLLALYPASPTQQETLELLHMLQCSSGDRAEFRLVLADNSRCHKQTALCCLREGGRTILILGSMANFGLDEPQIGEANVVIPCDGQLQAEYRNWFDFNWLVSSPLTRQAVEIPALVPARGDPRAGELWDDYVRRCKSMHLDGRAPGQMSSGNAQSAEVSPPPVVAVDLKTGEVTVKSKDGTAVPSPCDDLGVPKYDVLAVEMAKLFRKGQLVVVDKSSRVGPLDVPMKAEWLGLKSFGKKVGVVVVESKYRISVIDKDDLKRLDAKRNAITGLLERLSFPLGDGTRWIPLEAKAIFEEEVGRIDVDGRQMLSQVVGGDIANFVSDRRDDILKAANTVYREVNPDASEKQLSEDVIGAMIEAVKARLNKATGGTLLPKVTYTDVSFAVTTESEHTSAWGHALAMLMAIVQFPRRSITDAYFMRGLRVDEETLIAAMDVCEDDIIAALRTTNAWVLRRRAEEELALLETIASADCDNHAKADAILLVIAGEAEKARDKIRPNPAKEFAGNSVPDSET